MFGPPPPRAAALSRSLCGEGWTMTGDRLYDFVLVGILLIVGVGFGLKADKWWGWLIVAAAFWLGYRTIYG